MWDVTCSDTLALSYSSLTSRKAGAVAEEAVRRKRGKNSHLEASHHFTPMAVESLGVFGPDARSFLQNLGRRLRETISEPSSYHHLLQRVSVALQRGNAAALLGTQGDPELAADPFSLFNLKFQNVLVVISCLLLLF